MRHGINRVFLEGRATRAPSLLQSQTQLNTSIVSLDTYLSCVMLWRALQPPLRLKNGPLYRPSTRLILRSRAESTKASGFIRRITVSDSQIDNTRSIPTVRYVDLLTKSHWTKDTRQKHEAETIQISGLVRSIRKQKNIAFARINDGSTYANIQAVFPDPQSAKEYGRSP